MNEILTKEEIKLILKEFKGELDYRSIDYLDIDYSQVQQLLTSGPAIEYLPIKDENYKENLPLLNTRGEYEYKTDGKTIIIPEEYMPAVNFSSMTFLNLNKNINKMQLLFENFWMRFEKFISDVFRKKKKVSDQLEYILVNSDKYYQELRDNMYDLKKEYGDDNVFEIIFLLPDLFIYLCRLLTDIRIPKEYKIEIILALIYLVSPVDFIPEGLINHPIALMDDLGVIIFVVRKGFNDKYIPRNALEKHWPGDVDLIDNIEEWYEAIYNVIGKDIVEMIQKYHRRKTEGA